MVEHRSHSAGLEYDASAGWKLRKLGRDIRRRRRHLRLVDDSAVSSHDANLRFRHRHVQPGKILHVDSPLPRQSRSYRLLQKSRDHYPMLKKSRTVPRFLRTVIILSASSLGAIFLRPPDDWTR